MKMKKAILVSALVWCGSVLVLGGTYEDLTARADRLFREKKFKDAATAYEDAALETESSAKRIRAKFGCWESLKQVRNGDAVGAAESLLYEESELSPEQMRTLIEFIAERSGEERRDKAIKFGAKKEGLTEYDRSLILKIAVNYGGAWDHASEEILAMKHPAPAARAVALGNVATTTLWGKRSPQTALPMFNEALAYKELGEEERQFFLLGRARCYMSLQNSRLAERDYRQALTLAAQPDLQNAGYGELLYLYSRLSKEPMKIGPLLEKAAKDESLRQRDRQRFVHMLEEFNKAKTNRKP